MDHDIGPEIGTTTHHIHPPCEGATANGTSLKGNQGSVVVAIAIVVLTVLFAFIVISH